MTRHTFLAATAIFWLVVLVVWAASLRAPAEPPPAPDAATYTLAQVAGHKTAQDCWMAIGGEVYDLTPYVAQHPSDPAIFLPWCGREATDAYETKTKGRSHSKYADQLLATYRLGPIDTGSK